MQTIFPGSSLDASAIFQDDGCCVDGTVDGNVSCISDGEGICGEGLSFFDDDVGIGEDGEALLPFSAAQGDGILSVTYNEEVTDIKSERIMRDNEHSHDLPGFKPIEDDMTVPFPSVGKAIPLTGIFRDDGYNSVIPPDLQSIHFADIGEATRGRIIFRHLL